MSDQAPTTPVVTSYWAVDGLPQYQFTDPYDVIDSVRQLLVHGVAPITVRRVIEDMNYPSVSDTQLPNSVPPFAEGTEANIVPLQPVN